MKILLLSADEVLSEIIAFRLELLGHEVTVRETLAAAIDQLETTRFSLAIVDTGLADSNARDVAVKFRNRFSKEDLPILILSNDPSLELVEKLFRVGINDFLLAPFEPSTLQKKIEKLLETQLVTLS